MKQQYLAFRLGEKEYATSLDPVLEVRAYDARRLPTRIFVNSLQEHVPVVNLRKRLALGEYPESALPVALVLDMVGTLVAVVVDAVVEMLAVEPGQVLPATGTTCHKLPVHGVVALGERRVFVTDFLPIAGEEVPSWAH